MRFTFPSGSTPLGGYTIKRGLGIGGFGEVYFAISDSGKEVALKRIARNLDVELRGVRQCLNLKHANLIDLWDIQIDDHGENWVVMEYVSGPSLRDVLSANENGLTPDDLVWWFQGIIAGVHYLHQNGIVHRDLKPGNIFQDNESQLVKIGDYGLSKFISCSRRSGHTESVGTVHYMAPEIGRGIYGREIDIYSLGIVLFELLTGRVPYEGESTQEIIMKHLTATPDVSALPAPFDKVVTKALVKDPVDRYSSVMEMLFDLPKDFWPPAMRRSMNQLLDTADHSGQAVAPATAVASVHSMQANPRDLSSVQNSAMQANAISNSNATVEYDRRTLADQVPPSVSAVPPTIAPVLPSMTRFNVPPGASHNGNTGTRQNVGPAPSDYSLSRSDLTPGQTLDARFSTSGDAVVFGEVQFHDVVDAEMVFSATDIAPINGDQEQESAPLRSEDAGSAQRTSVEAGKTIQPQDAASVAAGEVKLSRKQRLEISTDALVQSTAARYLQQLSGVEQLAGLLQSFLISVLTSGLVAGGLLFAWGLTLSSRSQFDDLLAITTWFWIISFGSSWLLLAVSRMWTPTTDSHLLRTLSLIPASVAAGGLATVIAIVIDVYFFPIQASRQWLTGGFLGSLLFDRGLPKFSAYAMFFAALFLIIPWWKQTSPLRIRRISIMQTLKVAGVAFLFSALLNFEMLLPIALGVSISLSTQISSMFFTDRQRLDVREMAVRP